MSGQCRARRRETRRLIQRGEAADATVGAALVDVVAVGAVTPVVPITGEAVVGTAAGSVARGVVPTCADPVWMNGATRGKPFGLIT
jgi:hypothetical protein